MIEDRRRRSKPSLAEVATLSQALEKRYYEVETTPMKPENSQRKTALENPSTRFNLNRLVEQVREKEKELAENPPRPEEFKGDRLKLRVDTKKEKLGAAGFKAYRFRSSVLAQLDGEIGHIKLIPHSDDYGFTLTARGTLLESSLKTQEELPGTVWREMRAWEYNYQLLEHLRNLLYDIGISDIKKVIWPSYDLPEWRGPENTEKVGGDVEDGEVPYEEASKWHRTYFSREELEGGERR